MAQSTDGREQVGLEGPDADAAQRVGTIDPADAGASEAVDAHTNHAHRRHHAEQADIHAIARNDAREDDVVSQPEDQVSNKVEGCGVLELQLEALLFLAVHRRTSVLHVLFHLDHEGVLQQVERCIAARGAQDGERRTVGTRAIAARVNACLLAYPANIPMVTKITPR
eukprot:COSAG02_NODE_83_length_39665_cov_25.213719_9_plen_168_part_00